MQRQSQSKKPSSTPVATVQAQFQSRPFAEPQTPEVQTKQEASPGFEHNFANIAVTPPTPPNPSQLPSLQMKGLKVGAENDPLEAEADKFAVDVSNKIQRQAQEGEEENVIQTKLSRSSSLHRKLTLQREAIEGEEESVIQAKLAAPFSLHRKLIVQRQAIEAGETSATLTNEINSAKSGGQPLDSTLQTKLENATGHDFSSVKVHTDSTSDTLNRSLNSRAFTTGNNIFFKKNEYNPNTESGQQLIFHETAHVMQQGASSIQAKRDSVAVPSLVNSTMLQMKSVVVNDTAQTRQPNNTTSSSLSPVKVIEKAPKGNKYEKGDIVEISDNDTEHISENNEVVWYKIQGSNPPQYIRASKIFNVNVAPTNTDIEGPEGDDLLENVNEGVIGTTGDSIGEYSDSLKEEDENANTTDLDIAKGVFGTIGGILSMAISIKNLIGNGQRGITDWISAIWENLTNAANLTSSISQIAASANDSETTQSVSDWSGSFGGAMSTLSSGITTIKSVADLINMIASDDKYDKNEYIKVGSEIISGALETAKGVVESVKSFLDIFNAGTAGLASAVPAIGIAISATQTIVQGYYLAVSAYYWSKMRKESQTINTNNQQLGTAKNEYRKINAEISNNELRREEKTQKNTNRQSQIEALNDEINTLDQEKTTLQNEQTNLNTEKNQLNGKQTKTPADKKRIKEIETRLEKINDRIKGTFLSKGIDELITKNNNEITELRRLQGITENKINLATSNINSAENQKNLALEEKIEELDLTEELSSGNKKRVIRQAIHISTNAVKIAGNIATLAGVSAIAGITLQATAAGIETSLPFFRALKQYGRNVAAKNKAKGESGIANWIFNSDKSTKAKLDARKKNVVTIFKMVNNLNTFFPLPINPEQQQEKKAQLKAQAIRVEDYIKASGCSPKALYRNNGKPQEQAKILLQALYQREF